MTVDAPEQVIGGDVLVEAEIIKQPRRRLLNSQHRQFLPQNQRDSVNHAALMAAIIGDFFNNIGALLKFEAAVRSVRFLGLFCRSQMSKS